MGIRRRPTDGSYVRGWRVQFTAKAWQRSLAQGRRRDGFAEVNAVFLTARTWQGVHVACVLFASNCKAKEDYSSATLDFFAISMCFPPAAPLGILDDLYISSPKLTLTDRTRK